MDHNTWVDVFQILNAKSKSIIGVNILRDKMEKCLRKYAAMYLSLHKKKKHF